MLKALIAGAGIGGLTAALACLKRGMDVEVYEQASELKEVGAGLQLSANGNRVLYELGLEAQLKRLACEATGKEIRLWNSGETWKLFDLGAQSVALYGYPYFTIYRPDLHRILADAVKALKPNAIHLNSTCLGFKEEDDHVSLQLADRRVSGDVLIGADGVHSKMARCDSYGKFARTLAPHRSYQLGWSWRARCALPFECGETDELRRHQGA
jgi:salicylate hydroxylase